jgi:hypothetical protein
MLTGAVPVHKIDFYKYGNTKLIFRNMVAEKMKEFVFYYYLLHKKLSMFLIP